MAYAPRSTTSIPPGATATSLRQANNAYSVIPQQSASLAARITSKETELENLRQLRDLSAELAAQMQTLEEKIRTLKDGTEAVACVLANWDDVLQAISMSSMKVAELHNPASSEGNKVDPSGTVLPSTLVRIPAE